MKFSINFETAASFTLKVKTLRESILYRILLALSNIYIGWGLAFDLGMFHPKLLLGLIWLHGFIYMTSGISMIFNIFLDRKKKGLQSKINKATLINPSSKKIHESTIRHQQQDNTN